MFSIKKMAAVAAALALLATGSVAVPALADAPSGSVSTGSASEISSVGAVVTGTATSLKDGEPHFCVSASSAVTSNGNLADVIGCADATSPSKIEGNGTVTFTGAVFGLSPNTTYYFQANVSQGDPNYVPTPGQTETDNKKDKSYKKDNERSATKSRGGQGNGGGTPSVFYYGGVKSFTTDSVVTYNSNDGSGATAPQDFASGQNACTFNAGFIRDGYDFVGWNTSATGTSALSSCNVSGNSTLYAVWSKTAIPQVTVTLNLNGGSYAASTVNKTYTVDKGSVFTLSQAPTKAGCTFNGWLVAPTVYQLSSTLTVTSDVTAVAQWARCSTGGSGGGSGGGGSGGGSGGGTTSTVTVTYYSNNGENLSSTVDLAVGSPVSLSAPSWLKTDFEFAGWATDPAGAAISGSLDATSNLSLYAVWASSGIKKTVITNLNSVVVNLTDGSYTFPPAKSNSPAEINVSVVCNGAGEVSGRTIALIAPGLCLITATQQAVEGFTSGTASMVVTIVSYGATDPGKGDGDSEMELNRLNGMITLKSSVNGGPVWEINLQGLDSKGVPAAMDPKNRIILGTGHQAATYGRGYLPNSDVYVYIFSNPKLLGILKTDANGAFVGSFTVPAGLEDGVHTIQIKGMTPDKKLRTSTVEVIVDNANKSTRVVAKQLFFKADKATLSSAVVAELKKIVSMVKGKTNIRMNATGWIFGHGKTAAEKKLATARTKAIAAYFKKAGIKVAFTHKSNGKALDKALTARRIDLLINYTLP